MQSQNQDPASYPASTRPKGTSPSNDTLHLPERFKRQFEDLLISHRQHGELRQRKWSALNDKETGLYIRRETQASASARKVTTNPAPSSREVIERYLKRNRGVNQTFVRMMQHDREIGDSMRSFKEKYAKLEWGYTPPELNDQVFDSLGAFDDQPPTLEYLSSVRSARDKARVELQSMYREIDTLTQGRDGTERSKLELELQCGELEYRLGKLNSQVYFANRVFESNPDLLIMDGKVVDPSNASAIDTSAEFHVPDQAEPKATTTLPSSINPGGAMNFLSYPLDPSLDNAGDCASEAAGWGRVETRPSPGGNSVQYEYIPVGEFALAGLAPEDEDEDEEYEDADAEEMDWEQTSI
ncbi:hypothetical protein I302_104765 [Kwoniella bestiolae CBS 10118]|uniref:Uncharacterized protein n=1 Tax=Kwoniella bestiolae CBS 10118 TaxID=1296100 RepID=A0A1B9FRU8_9TREE|nr:hypothetical protein I302_09165 [Kwoniella bestiolae CBS 10118]OCF21486.1 hypothetical protein I302_09165 [Kwoniella bestiolae CBS 10118]